MVHATSQEPPEAVVVAMRTLQAAIAEAAPEPELEMSLGGDDDFNDSTSAAGRANTRSAEPHAPASPTGALSDAAHRGAANDRAGAQGATADIADEDMELEDAALGALVREKLSKRLRASPY